jgi:hypothetical protein
MLTNDVQKPDGLTDDHLDYLDVLRETGKTNMFGAAPWLARAYHLDTETARKYLSYWMRTYSERHATAE